MAKSPTFDEVFTFDNMVLAAEECIKGVRWKHSIQSFNMGMYTYCKDLLEKLRTNSYKSKGFHIFVLKERGKTRIIRSVHISERVIQKTLVTYCLRPLLTPSLIYDNGASLQGKGTDFAIKRFREHLRWHYARHGTKGGILIGDFHGFFDSINHEKLIIMLRKKIKDDQLFNLTKYFIKQFDPDENASGLGLGSEISQICAIYYPNKLDHLIKEKYQIHGYARYIDDFYVISEDIEKLKEIYQAIKEIADELGLQLNEKVTGIITFENQHIFTFLKNKTFLTENGKIVSRLVRKNVALRREKIRTLNDLFLSGRIDHKYLDNSMNIWVSYAYKHKLSFTSIKNTCKYYKNVTAHRVKTVKQIYDIMWEDAA